MKILIVSKIATHPTDEGNKAGILAQAEILRQKGNEVHFLLINEIPLDKKKKDKHNQEVVATSNYWNDKFHNYTVRKSVKIMLALIKQYRKRFFKMHFRVDDQYPYGLSKYVNELNNRYHFDACIINYFYLSRLFENITIPKRAIFTHDCMSYKDIKLGFPAFCTTADTEAKAMQRCPHIFAVQTIEADFFQLLSPNSMVYNIFGGFTYHSQEIANNHNLVFLSGGNIFNQNGLNWFLENIYPEIRNRFSDAKLIIGGSICKVLANRNIQNIEIQGYIDNPYDFYSQADICINPCYQGTGLKIKTFESISYDKITMVHPHSKDGIYDKEHAPLFASDKAEDWVKFLESVWDNPEKLKEIKAHNKEYLTAMEKFVDSEYERFLRA